MSIKPKKIPKRELLKIWAQVPADYYDTGIANNIFQKLWHKKKLSQVIKFVPKKSTKMLDIGCSSGIITYEISKILPKNSKIYGADCYKEAIGLATSKYPKISFIVADAHKLPFKNKSFDLIICTETLEHVVDPKTTLLEMKRVLKENGVAVISMDSGNLLFRTIWFLWTKTKGKVWENSHLHEFNAEILEKLIKNAGFKIKKKEYSHLGMAITFLISPKKKASS